MKINEKWYRKKHLKFYRMANGFFAECPHCTSIMENIWTLSPSIVWSCSYCHKKFEEFGLHGEYRKMKKKGGE